MPQPVVPVVLQPEDNPLIQKIHHSVFLVGLLAIFLNGILFAESESRVLKPVKGVASGIGQVVNAPKKMIEGTVKETKSGPPVLGTVEGVKRNSGEMVDSTVKGAYKVATLGYGEAKEVLVENPEKSSGSLDPGERKPTKFKIPF